MVLACLRLISSTSVFSAHSYPLTSLPFLFQRIRPGERTNHALGICSRQSSPGSEEETQQQQVERCEQLGCLEDEISLLHDIGFSPPAKPPPFRLLESQGRPDFRRWAFRIESIALSKRTQTALCAHNSAGLALIDGTRPPWPPYRRHVPVR